MTEIPTDGYWRLLPENIDSVEFVSADAFERILDATGSSIAGRVDFQRSRMLLNDLVRQTVRQQFKSRIGKSELDELRACATSLFQCIDNLRHHNVPPPASYESWVKDLLSYEEEMQAALRAGSNRGRPPSPVKKFFVPRVLGLFAVLFEEAPTAHAKTGERKNRSSSHYPDNRIMSPAARFIDACLGEIDREIDRLRIRVVQPELKKVMAQWRPLDNPTLEQWLRDGLNDFTVPPEQEGSRVVSPDAGYAANDPEAKKWRLYSKLYAVQCEKLHS